MQLQQLLCGSDTKEGKYIKDANMRTKAGDNRLGCFVVSAQWSFANENREMFSRKTSL